MGKSLDVIVRTLQRTDDRLSFVSGQYELDRFFHRYAGQNQFKHHIGMTYVAEVDSRIAGFVTISSGQLAGDHHIRRSVIKRLPQYPLPVLRIARLGVNKPDQGTGIGKVLLKAMLKLSLDQRDRVGCCGVVVDAKPEAIAFYDKYGFLRLEETMEGALNERPEPIPMFISIKTIEKSLTQGGRQ